MDPLTAIAIAGTLVSAWGMYQSSKKEAEIMEQQSAANELEAQKLMERYEMNAELSKREGRQMIGTQIAKFAGAGFDISGSTLLALEQTNKSINEEINMLREEAEFAAEQIRRGAGFKREEAAASRKAGKYALVGGLAKTAGYASSLGGSGKNTTKSYTMDTINISA